MGRENIVRHLLSRGARPVGPTKASVLGPLVNAVWGGSVGTVKVLIDAGSRVDPEPGKDSALDAAALKGRLDMVRLLLDSGANPNHRSSGKNTPLMSAVRSENPDIARTLIAEGADLNAESEDGMTVLDRAIQQKATGIIEILRKAGATRTTRYGENRSLTQAPTAKKSEQLWQLRDESDFSVSIEPWPPTSGAAKLKAEINSEPELLGGWDVHYCIRHETDPDQDWRRMFAAEKEDEFDDDRFEVEVRLEPGTWLVEFKVSGKMHKEPDLVSGWKITVA
jgi:hypothetical protein